MIDQWLKRMGLTRPAFYFTTLGSVVTLVFFIVTSLSFVRIFETRLTQIIETNIPVDSLSWIEYEVDGSQIYLRGKAPSEVEQVKVIETLGAFLNHRNIIDEMTYGNIPREKAAINIEIIKNRNMASVIGLLPSEPSLIAIYQAVARKDRNIEALNMIERSMENPSEIWGEQHDFIITAIDKLDNFKIAVREGRVEILTLIENPDKIADLRSELLAVAPDGLELILDIQAPRPIISPFVISISKEAGKYELHKCSATDIGELLAIQKSLESLNTRDFDDCALGLGAAHENWGRFVSATIQALNEYPDYELEIIDSNVNLSVNNQPMNGNIDALNSSIRGILPPGFSLNSDIQFSQAALESLQNTPDTRAFKIIITQTGQLQVNGLVASAEGMDNVETLLRSKFEDNEIESDLLVSDELPILWDAEVIEAIDLAGELSQGRVELFENALVLKGVVHSIKTQSALQDRINERFKDYILTEEIEVVELASNISSSSECVNDIQNVLSAKQVIFEPNSATITEESQEPVTQIAQILSKCHAYDFEIAGYTDSSGNDAANLQISKNRANAVLDMILIQGLMYGDLIAEGYGEANPIAANDTPEGRALNRRIEVHLITDNNASEHNEVEENPE